MDITKEEAEKILYVAISIGEELLESGAEANRVEDTVSRILHAYGATRTDVFSISASLEVTAHFGDFHTVTQTRRIRSICNDMGRIHVLNQLSRDICSADPPPAPEEVLEQLRNVETSPDYTGYAMPLQIFSYALVSGSFTVFFGGDAWDCIAGAVIGILLKLLESFLAPIVSNRLLLAIFWSLAGGLMALVCTRIGFGHHADMISIGNIMLFIPGIAFTNAIRDLFYGDTITGLVRFFESIILAIAIAAGFTTASVLL